MPSVTSTGSSDYAGISALHKQQWRTMQKEAYNVERGGTRFRELGVVYM